MEFLEISKDEYETFQLNHTYRHFLNSVEAIELKQKNGWSTYFLGVKENGTLLAATALVATPIMKVYQYVSAQSGFLIDYRNEALFSFFLKELIIYLKQKKALYLHVNPYILYQQRDKDANIVEGGFDNKDIIEILTKHGFEHIGFTKGNSTIYQPRWMFTLSLEGKTKEDVLANMHQQTRWSINKTLREGICVRKLEKDEISIFIDIMNHTGERRNFESNDEAYYREFLDTYGDKATLLLSYLDVHKHIAKLEEEKQGSLKELEEVHQHLVAAPNSKKFIKRKRVIEEAIEIYDRKILKATTLGEKRGMEIPLAASIFMLQGDELTYLFSGSYDEYKQYNGPYALQWHIIQYAIDHHYKVYNFYGTSGDFRKEAEDYGVYEFKKGFDGQVEELLGDFVLPIHTSMFKVYKKMKKERF